MQASLCLHRGILYVGRHEKTAYVETYDLDGRPLGSSFSFRDPRLGRSAAAGLAVDDDRNVWVADTPISRVRRFTLFGQEIGGLGLGLDEPIDPHDSVDVVACVRRPVDVDVVGDSDGLVLAVALGGVRRHAVQLFAEDGRCLASLRPGGDPHGRFRDVCGVALHERFVYVAEAGSGRVQVFRDGDFHFAMRPTGASFEPTAIAPLADGRIVVATRGEGSGLLVLDASGELARVLAHAGAAEGRVSEPTDVVVEQDARLDDRHTRVAVIDREGERVQVFNLEGRAFGSFEAPEPGRSEGGGSLL